MTQQADITRAQPDQPAGAQRIVPEDAFVGIPDPDSTGAVGQDMLNAIAERFLGQGMAPGVIDDCVAGQDLGAPLRSGSHQQDVAAGKGLHGEGGKARPGEAGDGNDVRGMHAHPGSHSSGHRLPAATGSSA